jgi:hypothetical protein
MVLVLVVMVMVWDLCMLSGWPALCLVMPLLLLVYLTHCPSCWMPVLLLLLVVMIVVVLVVVVID